MIGFIIMLVAGFLQRNETEVSLEGIFTPPAAPEMEGFVDLSGLLETLPPEAGDGLTRYPSEVSARAALESEDIGAYYVIAADYMRPALSNMSNRTTTRWAAWAKATRSVRR